MYSWTRNQFGSNAVPAGTPGSRRSTTRVRHPLRADLGLFHEETIQELYLPYRGFMQFWNTYYGVAHFVVTLGVFVVLFWKRPDVFPMWRNSLAITTAWRSSASPCSR